MRVLSSILPFALVAAVPAVAAETVPVPAFRSIELRGGGSIIVRPGPARVTIVNGSTEFTRFRVDDRGKLEIDACNQRCPRNYDLAIEVRYPKVPRMGVKGGGRITAAPGFGPQRDLAAGVGGGGLIDLRSVTAETVAAGINGGGKIFVGPSKRLAAGVNGGGEIRYAGNPQVTSGVTGGGTVRRDE